MRKKLGDLFSIRLFVVHNRNVPLNKCVVIVCMCSFDRAMNATERTHTHTQEEKNGLNEYGAVRGLKFDSLRMAI